MKRKDSPRCLAEGCSKDYAVIVAEFPWLLCRRCAKVRKSRIMCRRPKETNYVSA